ncbi:unnamed protein product, partial [Choristocarpus tenellus]
MPKEEEEQDDDDGYEDDGWDFMDIEEYLEQAEEKEEEPKMEESNEANADFMRGHAQMYTKQAIKAGASRIVNRAMKDGFNAMKNKVRGDSEFKWYMLRVHKQKELYVRDNIVSQIKTWGWEHKVDELFVPTKKRFNNQGKEVTFVVEPMHPAYVYLHATMDLELRDRINDMDKVVGFAGVQKDEDKKLIPKAMSDAEIDNIKETEAKFRAEPERKVINKGVMVEIMEGGFEGHKGEIFKVKEDGYAVKIYAYGRNTDVEVSWDGVRRLSEMEIQEWLDDTKQAIDATYMKRQHQSTRKFVGRDERKVLLGEEAQQAEEYRQRYFQEGPERHMQRRNGYNEDINSGLGRNEYPRGRAGRGRGNKGTRGRVGVGRDGRGGRGSMGGWSEGLFDQDQAIFEARQPKSRRDTQPEGEDLDRLLPNEAFASKEDADDFFKSLDGILSEFDDFDSKDNKRLPQAPGARQGPLSDVERVHAKAAAKKELLDSSPSPSPTVGLSSTSRLMAGAGADSAYWDGGDDTIAPSWDGTGGDTVLPGDSSVSSGGGVAEGG